VAPAAAAPAAGSPLPWAAGPSGCGGSSGGEDDDDELAAELSASGLLPAGLEARAGSLCGSKASCGGSFQRLASSRLGRADSALNACDVCFEERALLALAPCSHSLCHACAQAMCAQDKMHPLPCPFCRVCIRGFAAK
jgi:hypothetical protein